MKLVQHLSAKRARRRYAKVIAARPAPAAAVEQPVAADEGAARRANRVGVLPLCRRHQGPQNRVRRERHTNRGLAQVGVQEARPLGSGTSGNEG